MKKNVFFIVILFSFPPGIFAQKTDESKIPEPAKQAFQQKFPGIKGQWEKEKANYEVNFISEGKTMSAVIDAKGSILETETTITLKELPAGIENYIKIHYRGATIKEAARIVKAGGETIYEAGINKKDILFDASGKFMKEAKD